MSIQEELNEFVEAANRVFNEKCPSFLTPNSHFVGVIPGHNLDLLQISFDFRIDRTSLIGSPIPEYLNDPSKPELRVIK